MRRCPFPRGSDGDHAGLSSFDVPQVRGGPFMAVPCTAASFAGQLRHYASSDGVERGFCATCGSNLFFHIDGGPVHAIPIALFDDQSELPFRAEIYIDDKPDYYAFANATKKMTGAEFGAKFKGR